MLIYKKAFEIFSTMKVKPSEVIGGSALQNMRNGGHITTKTINRLCAALDCQPGDLMEYIPDKEEREDDSI